jgi:hypothetical protein
MDGSVLVLSVIILSLMLTVSLTVFSSAAFQRRSSLSTGGSVKAFQRADSAMELVLFQTYMESPTPSKLSDVASNIQDVIDGTVSCSGGVISSSDGGWDAAFYTGDDGSTSISCTATDWRTKLSVIRSRGMSQGSVRAVEVSVSAP